MVRFTGGLLLFSAFAAAAPRAERAQVPQVQQPLLLAASKKPPVPRQLKGRFLHITDVHPDSFYKVGSDTATASACHKGSGDAGPFGAPLSSCDSPFSLINATFNWIDQNLRDEVDFVIWTGDSARHDNDEDIPRTEKEVVGVNEYVVNKMVEVFGKDDKIDDPDPTNDFIVPIVPTFGNNDILPHNIFEEGPNKWTRTYLSTVWNKFIPEEQYHSFARGGWFFTEVIPNRLAVFSLNTLYFFDSNSAVDGCDAKSEPGYEHMEWLRIQLQFLRQRKMKAILTGHVPPARTANKALWDESCWQKYTLWMERYRDVVVGGVYGHVNLDHFLIEDSKEVNYKIKGHKGWAKVELESKNSTTPQRTSFWNEDGFGITAKPDSYLTGLRDAWASLPSPPSGMSYAELDMIDMAKKKKPSKKEKERQKFLDEIGGKYAERYSHILVSPSVVPNYFPTLRVVEYNISGLGASATSFTKEEAAVSYSDVYEDEEDFLDEEDFVDEDELVDEEDVVDPEDESSELEAMKKKKKKKKKKPKQPTFTVPRSPPKSAPPGPAYSPQTFTFLSYVQYFANLTQINHETHKLELNNKAPFKKPEPGPSLQAFYYEVEYDTRNDTIFKLQDLTVRSYLDLAARIAVRAKDSGSGQEMDPDLVNGLEWAGDDKYDDDALVVAEEEHGATEEAEDEENAEEEEMEAEETKQQKKEKEKEPKKNKAWHGFVKRAFVLTRPDDQIAE